MLKINYYSSNGSAIVTENQSEEAAILANQTAYNVSRLLNNLLKDYDNTLRPNFGGPTTLIDVNMQVRSMGPISEMDMVSLQLKITII